MQLLTGLVVLASALFASSSPLPAANTTVLYDGRAPLNLTAADLNSNKGPFLTVVKGSQDASHYSSLLGKTQAPTPLWNAGAAREQAISISIDNSSIFVPGGNPQNGFRRTEFIAARDGEHTELLNVIETGVTAFHFSIKEDAARPLNYSHEYQIVFIEPNDGSHVFGIQLGSPFTNPTGALPVANARSFKVLDHANNILFETPFAAKAWHNFAVQVDWTNRSLAVLFSRDAAPLAVVKTATPNLSAAAGAAGQGDFHFGVLKLPIVNPADSAANQGDVVHFGTQEGTTEALLYSGVFVEDATKGISLGYGLVKGAL